MNINDKIKNLKIILDKANTLDNKSSGDSDFLAWKNLTVRIFTNIFGKESDELITFKKLEFFFIYGEGNDHIICFKRDLETIKKTIYLFIEDFETNKSMYRKEAINYKFKKVYKYFKEKKWLFWLLTLIIAIVSGIIILYIGKYI